MWITKLNRDASMAQISTSSSTLYEKLRLLFTDEIKAKQLNIREDLSIEFTDTRLYFGVGVYKLTQTQKIFLDKFSKKLLPFLLQNREFIDTLEVNGHTSSEWGTANFTQKYLKNEKLSMERSFATISHIFQKQTKETQKWLSKILQGSGFSYSKNIMFNEVEDKKKSRRVTFKVILK
jgi:outer membrane protein OmpA-like peptidoglycan-associated protein